MSDAVDSESIKFLEEVKKGKPRRFILLCKGSAIQRLVVSKKGSAESMLQRTKKEGFKGQAYIGVVDGKGQDISFKLCTADGYDSGPGKDAFLKAFLSTEAGITCKPKYEIVPELPKVSEEDDEGTAPPESASPAIARTGDPNIELRQNMREAIQKLTPAVKIFVTSNLERRQEVLGPLERLKNFALGDPVVDKAAALEAMKTIQKLVAGTPREKPAAAPSEATGQRGQKIWHDAVQAVLQQVDTLKQAIAEHEDESYQSLSKTIVSTVTKRFDERLAEACRQFDESPAENTQGVAGVIRDYTSFIKDDEMLKMLDDNPFDVRLSVRSTLAKALAEVDKCVKAAAKV